MRLVLVSHEPPSCLVLREYRRADAAAVAQMAEEVRVSLPLLASVEDPVSVIAGQTGNLMWRDATNARDFLDGSL